MSIPFVDNFLFLNARFLEAKCGVPNLTDPSVVNNPTYIVGFSPVYNIADGSLYYVSGGDKDAGWQFTKLVTQDQFDTLNNAFGSLALILNTENRQNIINIATMLVDRNWSIPSGGAYSVGARVVNLGGSLSVTDGTETALDNFVLDKASGYGVAGNTNLNALVSHNNSGQAYLTVLKKGSVVNIKASGKAKCIDGVGVGTVTFHVRKKSDNSLVGEITTQSYNLFSSTSHYQNISTPPLIFETDEDNMELYLSYSIDKDSIDVDVNSVYFDIGVDTRGGDAIFSVDQSSNAYTLDMRKGSYIKLHSGASTDLQITLSNVVTLRKFRINLTGHVSHTLNSTLFAGITNTWLGSSTIEDYNPTENNVLLCEVTEDGSEIKLRWENDYSSGGGETPSVGLGYVDLDGATALDTTQYKHFNVGVIPNADQKYTVNGLEVGASYSLVLHVTAAQTQRPDVAALLAASEGKTPAPQMLNSLTFIQAGETGYKIQIDIYNITDNSYMYDAYKIG